MSSRSELPAQNGYYWFRGQVKRPDQKRGSYRLTIAYVFKTSVDIDGKRYASECFDGEWWGPVEPPWADE